MINWSILGEWQNWAIVLFVILLLVLIANIFSPFLSTMEHN